jgi:glycosyltransferase involved in cell wall biosynthesis
MIEVLYLVSTLERSGPTNQLKNIVSALYTDKFSPSILTFSPEPSNSAVEEFKELDINLQSVGASRIQGLWEVPRYLRTTVARDPPDVIHSQGVRPDVFSSYLLPDQTRVSTLRNYPYYDYPKAFGETRGNIVANMQLRSMRRLEYPVACADTVRRLANQHGLSLDVIRNGVDTKYFSSVSNEEKQRRREDLQLPRDEHVFVSVGALSTRKDPTTVARGFLTSEASRSGTLVFLGNGDKRQTLESIAAGDNTIRLEGYVENVLEYLQAADYFISASTAEGLPNTVMEALACGLPVCLSSIGPHKEILDLGNEFGTEFECQDIAGLSFALDQLVSSVRKPLSDNARAVAEDHLSAERTSRRYQNLYERAVTEQS